MMEWCNCWRGVMHLMYPERDALSQGSNKQGNDLEETLIEKNNNNNKTENINGLSDGMPLERHKEPLLLARVVTEDHIGNWNTLQPLPTPSHWKRIIPGIQMQHPLRPRESSGSIPQSFTPLIALPSSFSDSDDEDMAVKIDKFKCTTSTAASGLAKTRGREEISQINNSQNNLIEVIADGTTPVEADESPPLAKEELDKADSSGDEADESSDSDIEAGASDNNREELETNDEKSASKSPGRMSSVSREGRLMRVTRKKSSSSVTQMQDTVKSFKSMGKTSSSCSVSPTLPGGERTGEPGSLTQILLEHNENDHSDASPESRRSMMSRISEQSQQEHGTMGSPSVDPETALVGTYVNPHNLTYKGKSFAHLFELGEQIGYGSTAHVFKCRRKRQMHENENESIVSGMSSTSGGAVFACKIIDKKKLLIQMGTVKTEGNKKNGLSLVEQFKQEIEVLDKLRHPHIIRLFGMFESAKTLYVVTEYCAGGELFSLVSHLPTGSVPEEIAKDMIKQVTDAISYMHEQGIIHRDIKLENILLRKKPLFGQNGELSPNQKFDLKLIDFGLAKDTGFRLSSENLKLKEANRGRANTFFGTLGYLAPEMFLKRSYNHGIDVWALGVMSYILLCGNFPFDETPQFMANLRTLRGANQLREAYKLKFPVRLRGKLSAEAKDFVSKLLEPIPSARMPARNALEHKWFAQAEVGTSKAQDDTLSKHVATFSQKQPRALHTSVAV